MNVGFLWNLIKDCYIFILVVWLIVAAVLRTHRHYKIYLTLSALFYVTILLYVTLFGRTASTEYQMELSFLWEYRLAMKGNKIWCMQILDNIMLFVPMGWLYGGLKDKSGCFGVVAFGVGGSLVIELCQLIFKLGLFELDDIFNNLIGMMLGYGLWRVSKRKM